jgi:hypothetical protein
MSDVITGQSAATRPGAPTQVLAIAGDGEATLAWNTVPGATGYDIYSRPNDGSPVLFKAGVTGTSVTLTGLSNGTMYFFGVSAVNASGASALSAQAYVTPLGDPSFEAPNVGSGVQFNPTGTAWTFSGTSGIAGNGSSLTSGNPSAPDGNQVAFLQGTGSVSQTVNFSLAAGGWLSFEAAQTSGSNQTIQVLVNGVVVGTFTPSGTDYQRFAVLLPNVGPNTTVTFQSLDPNGGTVLIDALNVNPAGGL